LPVAFRLQKEKFALFAWHLSFILPSTYSGEELTPTFPTFSTLFFAFYFPPFQFLFMQISFAWHCCLLSHKDVVTSLLPIPHFCSGPPFSLSCLYTICTFFLHFIVLSFWPGQQQPHVDVGHGWPPTTSVTSVSKIVE